MGLDSSWVHPWPREGLDGAGPSTVIGSVGLGRVQMMLRHLASVGESYGQTALDDTTWSHWPMTQPQGVSGSSVTPVPSAVRYARNTGGLRFRNVSPSANDNISNMRAMADTVREVLPHIPEDIIFQVMLIFVSILLTLSSLATSYPCQLSLHNLLQAWMNFF